MKAIARPNLATPPAGGRRAFTLLEMMVVIAIISILAVSSVPAIRALTQTNTVASTHRQLLDDLALARLNAISGRRTVYVVFVPPTMRAHLDALTRDRLFPTAKDRQNALNQFTNLINGQYTAYAMFTRRTVGDQPGHENPQYLGPWRFLPEGMVFGTNMFVDLGRDWMTVANARDPQNRPLPYGYFPFPTANSPELRLPYVAFDPQGRMHYDGGSVPKRPGEAIPLLRGSVFYPKDAKGQYALKNPPDLVITEKGNTNRVDVRVDWLTGRAKVFKPWEQTAAWK